MSSNYMGDVSAYINNVYGASDALAAASSKSASDGYSLSFEDVLNLMVVQLQNQTMDDTVDTSEMLNQMIQMQVVQSITDITDATIMTYAASLVGKDVTIVSTDSKGGVTERVVTITGTGYCNGSQVVFAGDEMFALNQIAAVGTLPKNTSEDAAGTDKADGVNQAADAGKSENTDKTDNTGKSENTDQTENTGQTEEPGGAQAPEQSGEIPGDRPVENTEKTEDANIPTQEEDVVDPAAQAEQV